MPGTAVYSPVSLSAASNAPTGAQCPLIVDVDGCLLKTDLLWEGLVRIGAQRPANLLGAIAMCFYGKAALKRLVARLGEPSIESLPMTPTVVDLINEARREDRPVVLISGADQSQVQQLASRVGADAGHGTQDSVNLTGLKKLDKIKSMYSQFDYVGNSSTDLPIWHAARRGFVANPTLLTWWRARRLRDDVVLLTSARFPFRACVRALRPHQWVKNSLLLLPALAAHLAWTPASLLTILLGFVCFSLAASAVYIANDLIDLPHDRRHPSKRNRPFANGDLSISTGLLMFALLLVGALAMCLFLPPGFQLVLLVYLVLTSAYSTVLKRKPILDVITLAMLYAARVVAGGQLLSVPLSRWFLPFSVFFFLSLALIKRVTELNRHPVDDSNGIPGRGYLATDLQFLVPLGAVASMVSALVYCLYINGGEVLQQYSHPDRLWLGLPLLLYWQCRAWLIACRGEMADDPVVFAFRDRVSRVTIVAFLLIVFLSV